MLRIHREGVAGWIVRLRGRVIAWLRGEWGVREGWLCEIWAGLAERGAGGLPGCGEGLRAGVVVHVACVGGKPGVLAVLLAGMWVVGWRE